MERIKDGWLVEPWPVFFDSEEEAWDFADVYGGIPVRAKCQTGGSGGAPSSAPSAAHGTPSDAPSDQLGELTEDDFAC